ncbi:hypothetical protein ANN_17500 [Periplaneta americana]|uniref:Catalase core domain-containing protein n=1 Tax=Periplaneta americana TaxID=6978 RepID=A0ABQ8SU54_PERAM|nr:hypothetical protein ANN_17500 [Periplaneta americana]
MPNLESGHKRGNNTVGERFDPVLWIEFGVAQWSERLDPNMMWDFITLLPETTFQTLVYFSDRGTPQSYRHTNFHSVSTYKMVNDYGKAVYVKFHWMTHQGVKNLTAYEALQLAIQDPDYYTRDLYNAIGNGYYPSWTLCIQIMTFEEAKKFQFNPFDVTKVWPREQFKYTEVGKLTLFDNPTNQFAQVEQLAFSPAHLIPGLEPSPEKILQQEQRSWLKIQSTHSRTARQCHDGLVEACGESALPCRTVARWVRAFNDGRDRVEHGSAGSSECSNEEEVQAVSTFLDNDRRETRYDREGDAFLWRIVALAETWARSYEPLLKRQSNEWRHYWSPRKTVERRTPTNVKVMLIVVYDCDCVILTHTVPQRQYVNAHFRHFLEHNLRPALRRKRPHVLQNSPIILQDNARAHTTHPVADLYSRWRWEVLFHPPHSPKLSSCDYDLIPKMKEPLRDVRFRTVPDILQAGRLFAYGDAQRYRLGVNYLQLPVNCPTNRPVTNYQRNGLGTFESQGEAPNYYPNSFHGPQSLPSPVFSVYSASGDVNR